MPIDSCGSCSVIEATFNNTLVSVTDANGNSIGWSSVGKMGFKGSRKNTAYAAQVVSQDACRQAMGHCLKEVDVRVKGPTPISPPSGPVLVFIHKSVDGLRSIRFNQELLLISFEAGFWVR